MSTTQPNTYWRSLNELAKNDEYRQFMEREFPENASELTDGFSRRNFLQIMGASIALAGFAACRKPVQKIVPYSRMPENVIPGNPLFYATAMPLAGSLTGLVVETHEGRPTKVEGNDLHPDSLGGTNILHQASTLDLYDPDRSRGILQGGEPRTAEDFAAFCASTFTRDKRVAFLSEASSSQTLARLKQQVSGRFVASVWVTYEPTGEENVLLGTSMAFGSKLRPIHHYDKASVIASFGDDFLAPGPDSVRAAKQFAKGRRVMSTDDGMNRLYVVETNYTLTGSNAEHRLRVKESEIAQVLFAVAAAVGADGFNGYANAFTGHEDVRRLATDLRNAGGAAVVTAGPDQPAIVHAAVAAINMAIGAVGTGVTYAALPFADASDQNAAFRTLAADLAAGRYDALVMLGTNPVYTAPADLGFKTALASVPAVIHLSSHVDETSAALPSNGWHVNRAHFLETWGDGLSHTGAASVIQPMIQPLFGGLSDIEVLNLILTGQRVSGHELVKQTWAGRDWTRILHDGLQAGTAFGTETVRIAATSATRIRIAADATPTTSGLELAFKADPKLLDGRYANNGWLQELPDTITKITWDNVALMSPATAAGFGVEFPRASILRKPSDEEPMVSITANGQTLELPIWVVPGHADHAITVYAGYGRTHSGRVGNGQGVDVTPLRSSVNPLFTTATVTRISRTYPIASTQDHHSMEGRPFIRETSLDGYRAKPDFAAVMVKVPGPIDENGQAISLFNELTFPDHEPQWGMTIDLNACTGCGVCTIACQAENNIPVIGKKEVKRGREMHWIRVDRYFSGDVDGSPQVVHQPIPCMQCELAPCEQVCPVAATTHSDDGLNQMTYNRCIGTRYCANNCPFKVRRFNFFNYPKTWLTEGDDPEVVQMAMNPDVTIRFRGVMEKCTYCVQRLNRAKIQTKRETGNSRKPADGTVRTACQQACPSDAIYFGDVSDAASVVSGTKRNERNYLLLEELNIRPRTSYLAKLRNPNDATA